MERRLLVTLITFAASIPGIVGAELRLDGALDWGYVAGGRDASFDDRGQSKMRYGKDDDGAQVFGGFIQAQYDINAVWNAKLAIDVNPQADDALGVVDAFVQYRPLPVSGVRLRTKIGLFRPPVSFEHGADGWATLYTLNASAINSWVGEELGGAGLEVTAKRDLASRESNWYWALSGAIQYGNDPAGTALSFRGWSINNWQTAHGGTLNLPDIPATQNPRQNPYAEPFLELDDEPGYYTWGEIGKAGQFRLRALYYDNRADPFSHGRGQYGWCTSFWNIGAQASLPWNMGLIAQWMEGMTYAGPLINGVNAVKNGFDAQFLLLTKTHNKHRFSLRHDWFAVRDMDYNMYDQNDENGTGLTLSYQYRWSDRWLLGLEYLHVDSDRIAREASGQSRRQFETSVFGYARISI